MKHGNLNITENATITNLTMHKLGKIVIKHFKKQKDLFENVKPIS